MRQDGLTTGVLSMAVNISVTVLRLYCNVKDSLKFVDIDECNTDDYVCGHNYSAACNNTIGSYSCACLPGYRLWNISDKIVLCEG